MQSAEAPTFSRQIGKHYVLWFENTNSYSILSSDNRRLLNTYLASKDTASFISQLQDMEPYSTSEALRIYRELQGFLAQVNTIPEELPSPLEPVAIPEPFISKYYAFGTVRLRINYGSEAIMHLIHPQLEHAATTEEHDGASLDIFQSGQHFHLFKNHRFVGQYRSEEIHLLQGKFAMQLLTILYGNAESDWLATFHASTVCNNREAIMIIGDSGNGKSTLSALLMAHGWDLLADDITPMLADQQHLYRYPAAISIKKGAFETLTPLFENFKATDPQRHGTKQVTVKYVPPTNPFHVAQTHFECRKIVLVNYVAGAGASLKTCAPEQLLRLLIPDAWISPYPEHSRQFLDWLGQLSWYQLTYGDNAGAVAQFRELFGDR